MCKWIRNKTPSLLSSRRGGAESELGDQCISFCKPRQSPGSWLGLEDVACGTAPVAPGCFWSNNDSAKGVEVIGQTNGGDPSSYIWSCKVTLEANLWACLDESPRGTRAFDISYSNSGASVAFFPSSETGWLPPSLALLISKLQYCLSLSLRCLMPDCFSSISHVASKATKVHSSHE